MPRASSSDSDSEDKNRKEANKEISKSKRKRAEAVKVYKSAEFIDDSDLEDDPQPKEGPLAQDSITNSPHKRQKLASADDQGGNMQFQKSISREDKNTQQSDPEMPLSLIEAQPSISKEKLNSSKVKVTSTKVVKEKLPKANSSMEELNRDEATIKRLKSLVNACGARKNWSKVFQDCPKPSQKIGKLKGILAELGMTGRLSMEHAKKIKQKRELAQELADVQSFEQSMLSRGSQQKSATRDAKQNQGESGDDNDGDEKPVKRKSSALKSISAFLEDQSDDD